MRAVKRKSKKTNRRDRRAPGTTALLVLLLPVAVAAQSFSVSSCRLAATPMPPGVGFSLKSFPADALLRPPIWLPADRALTPRSVMLPRWSAEQLPFFCRIEHQWARTHRVPVKFRLGSVEYVDWLEGKRGAELHSAQ